MITGNSLRGHLHEGFVFDGRDWAKCRSPFPHSGRPSTIGVVIVQGVSFIWNQGFSLLCQNPNRSWSSENATPRAFKFLCRLIGEEHPPSGSAFFRFTANTCRLQGDQMITSSSPSIWTSSYTERLNSPLRPIADVCIFR